MPSLKAQTLSKELCTLFGVDDSNVNAKKYPLLLPLSSSKYPMITPKLIKKLLAVLLLMILF